MKIEIGKESFGTLCICAIRYCHGRQTYMPGLVQEICAGHLKELSDENGFCHHAERRASSD